MPYAEQRLDRIDLPSVLVVHNTYQRHGGEDSVVEAEIDLLRGAGASVATLFRSSGDTAHMRRLAKRPDQLVFNRAAYGEARAIIRQQQIQVVHCHNLVPLLSTSIYAAAAAEGVPVVQTVHNYRMGCLNGLHLRDGQICERCRPGHHVDGMRFSCYRGSRVQSVAFGVTQTVNAWRGAWHQPTRYITPGPFLRDKLIAWGIDAERVVVKPHFVPHAVDAPSAEGDYAVFVGRLSPEKGLDLLLDAWLDTFPKLVIVGDGPQRAELEQRVTQEARRNVRLVGHLPREGVNDVLQHARYLIMPSVWFETFGLVVIEAYAYGVPVIATRLGAMADVVQDGETGVLFTLNNPADLQRAVQILEADPAKRHSMRAAARRAYETSFSAGANIKLLQDVYAQALGGGRRDAMRREEYVKV